MASVIRESMDKGVDFLLAQQRPDGSWRSEYGGPMFLLPMYVAACHIAQRPIPAQRRAGMDAFLRHYLKPGGSLGLHEQDSACMFTTALGYVALRLLGATADDPQLAQMRSWMHLNGSALGAAAWGKFSLALLNLYPYEGLHPIAPELWLLPTAAPIHPGRMWCHSRMVYLPMAWLYGRRAARPVDGLTEQLRAELYTRPYEEIDFHRHRDTVAGADDRYPLSPVLKVVNRALSAWEARVPLALRTRALDEIYSQIHFEDRVTHYIDIGPVNGVLNSLVHHFQDPGGSREQRSFEALEEYLVETPEGIKFNGYNSTALWDTAFASQALMSTPDPGRARAGLERAFGFVEANQVRDDVPDHTRHYRHRSAGGWPFSDAAHGWPITDCTAEGFKAAVGLADWVSPGLPTERMEQAVRLMLGFQNPDGGWATYERKRAGNWMELLNPSQVFRKIMVDHSYPECSSACMQALAQAKGRYGAGLDRAIEGALRRGARFLRKSQRPEGGWYGSWAVCFTYGTWFGVTGLLAAGLPAGDEALRRACGFLVDRQNPDGGWGEHHRACTELRWVPAPSTASQTAWALSSLVRCGLADTAVARRAASFLVQRQQPNGDWPEEPLVGVFNASTLIDYENYRRYFPIWALAEYDRAATGGGV